MIINSKTNKAKSANGCFKNAGGAPESTKYSNIPTPNKKINMDLKVVDSIKLFHSD